jgi:GLPGLI family protein
MKKLKKTIMLVLGILVAGTLTLNAQNFQGIATYQSARKMGGISIKGNNMSPDIEKQLQESIRKMGQKEYELKFNLTESTWAEVESLGAAATTETSIGGMVMSSSSGQGIKYKNTSNELYINQTEIFGKIFLIKSELKNREWELTNETKKIGNYTAQKAVLIEMVQRNVISFDNDDNKETMRTDTVKIEAWFTSEIPVSQGPDKFWGLPGLIMELSDGKTTYLCTKVVLNPEEGVKIKRPSKGKKVTPEEFKVLVEEKTKEMMEKFDVKEGNGSSKTIKIQIGGN